MNEPDEPKSDLQPTGLMTIQPADAAGTDDDQSFALLALRNVDPAILARALGVDLVVAEMAVDAAQRSSLAQIIQLLTARPQLRPQFQNVYARAYFPGEFPLHVVDVRPVVPLRSRAPFALAVRYQNIADLAVVLVAVRVDAVGRSFLVEKHIGEAGPEGVVEIVFGEEYTLREGPVVFEVSLFRPDGAKALFRRTSHVLPPTASLTLGRFGSSLTRSAYRSYAASFVVECDLTVANGTDGPLALHQVIRWQLRDESGESLGSGTTDWPDDVTIPPLSVMATRVRLRAPRGSRAFAAYDSGSDVRIEVSVAPAGHDRLSAAIVSRTMETVGINVIEVGPFGGQQHDDLGQAASLVRDYLEQCSIGLDPIECRHITDTAASGLVIIENADEFGNLLEDWTFSNESIDVFVVQNFNWEDIEGRSGDEPGPATKGDRKDGVVLKKWGYTDGGVDKLVVALLGPLIGHEIGHYLGVPHLEAEGQLMHLWSVGRGSTITDLQCTAMHSHDWVK